MMPTTDFILNQNLDHSPIIMITFGSIRLTNILTDDCIVLKNGKNPAENQENYLAGSRNAVVFMHVRRRLLFLVAEILHTSFPGC